MGKVEFFLEEEEHNNLRKAKRKAAKKLGKRHFTWREVVLDWAKNNK